MKLLSEYTLDYIRRNRRGSISIMIAILMVTTMLSALCGFCYNMYMDNLNLIVKGEGNWHGELFDRTLGSDLPQIESFDSVESLMIKGAWMVAEIDDSRREYLVYRNATEEYWNSMPEQSVIMEGRVPSASGEIALSKQYFESHPDLSMGDSISLPLGLRTAPDGSVLEPVAPSLEGEVFQKTGDTTLKVVGKLDLSTSSTIPAYTALGYMEQSEILPQDEITVYLRFHNIRDTYEELPHIAAAIGYTTDEYGEYNLRYNMQYLTRLLIFSDQQKQMLSVVEMGQMPATFAAMGLLAVGIFVAVIHNAFSLSASARLSQLGILASIGATPHQIKRSVLLEAFALSALSLPAGLFLGQLSVKLLLDFINHRNMLVDNVDQVTFLLGWPSMLPSILLTLITVWWAAVIPARRVAKMPPIAAIRQGDSIKLKKPGRLNAGKLFGLTGELAGNAVHARKKSYRTATIALLLSFLTLVSFLFISTASEASRSFYQTDTAKWAEKDLEVALRNIQSQEDLVPLSQITGLPEVKSAIWFNELHGAVWLTPEQFSAEFSQAGGFEQAEEERSFRPPILRNGKYRVYNTLIGLDDKTFSQYCTQLGISPEPFYEEGHFRSILFNSIEDVTISTRRDPVRIPFLNVQPGNTFTLTEQMRDEDEGTFTYVIETAAVTDLLPMPQKHFRSALYDMVQFLPMSRVMQLSGNYISRQAQTFYGNLCAVSPDQIIPLDKKIEALCQVSLGSGDYSSYDENEYALRRQTSDQMMNLMFGFVVGLLTIIGLSNVWATILGNLNARRREFAMLRSVGIPPRQIRRMLGLEALLLGLGPMLLSLPILAVVLAYFLKLNEITLWEWLPHAPWLSILLYAAAVIMVMLCAYRVGSRKLLSENIVDAIRMDTL